MLRTVVIALLLLVAGVRSASAQSSDPPASPQEPCTRRTIAVSVTDKNGEPVTGLTAADFRAEFRSQPVEILSVTPRSHPIRIVVVVDRSGSMQDVWRVAAEAARHIYANAPSDVSLGLVLFNDAVTDKIYFDTPRAGIINSLVDIQKQKGATKGRTALRDALATALEMNPQPSVADVIYVITDAGDSASRTKLDALEKRFLATGVRLFAFILYEPFRTRARSPEELSGPAELKDLVERSGGATVPSVYPAKDLTQHLGNFYRRMMEPYEIAVELPVEVDKKRDWKLELVRANELKRPQLAYPRKLVPCAPPAAQTAAPSQ